MFLNLNKIHLQTSLTLKNWQMLKKIRQSRLNTLTWLLDQQHQKEVIIEFLPHISVKKKEVETETLLLNISLVIVQKTHLMSFYHSQRNSIKWLSETSRIIQGLTSTTSSMQRPKLSAIDKWATGRIMWSITSFLQSDTNSQVHLHPTKNVSNFSHLNPNLTLYPGPKQVSTHLGPIPYSTCARRPRLRAIFRRNHTLIYNLMKKLHLIITILWASKYLLKAKYNPKERAKKVTQQDKKHCQEKPMVKPMHILTQRSMLQRKRAIRDTL